MINDIDISLSLGQLIYGKKWILVACLYVLGALLPLTTIVMVFFPIEWTTEIIATIVEINILSVVILIVPVYLTVKNSNNKRQINIWLADAVKLTAYACTIGQYKAPTLPKGIRIRVTFELNGKKYHKESDIKIFGGAMGYIASFKKYADRYINILYSPQYDQVMILKDTVNTTKDTIQ